MCALTVQADVSGVARVHAILEHIIAKWGISTCPLNNAVAPSQVQSLKISETEFDRAICVNLKSLFNELHTCAPIMMKQDTDARTVSMSSINPLSGGVTRAVGAQAHVAAKAGILGLTRSLAKELRPNVSVKAICPAVIAIDLCAACSVIGRQN